MPYATACTCYLTCYIIPYAGSHNLLCVSVTLAGHLATSQDMAFREYLRIGCGARGSQLPSWHDRAVSRRNLGVEIPLCPSQTGVFCCS